MLKTYLNENLMEQSEEEKRTGLASYARVLKIYCGDMVLCNEMPNIDQSIYDNMSVDYSEEIEELNERIELLEETINEQEERITEDSTEEDDEKTSTYIKELEQEREELEDEREQLEGAPYNIDIFQWYLCNLSSYEIEALKSRGIIVSYSDILGCDVICVDHWGTSWDYVMTQSELATNYDEI